MDALVGLDQDKQPIGDGLVERSGSAACHGRAHGPRGGRDSADGCCSQIVITAMTIGTPMKAPAIPQRKPQKKTAKSTRNGDNETALHLAV
jgi:hypothetical protein